ncbi:MAG: NUMOD3 domain-containing DNA-binding protein [Candidatus Izemoplasmatales bacterium]
MFERYCHKCGKTMLYASKKNRNKAEKKGVSCKSCFFLQKKYLTLVNKKKYNKRKLNAEQVDFVKKIWNDQISVKKFIDKEIEKKRTEHKLNKQKTSWSRICPECKGVIFYKRKSNKDSAESKKAICSKCRGKKLSFRFKGEKNPFFGKKHTRESREKRQNTIAKSSKYKLFIEKTRTDEFRKKMSQKMMGDNNPRKGLGSLFDIWEKKYGKIDAKKRETEWKKKLSNASSGENNYWFGQPPPAKSGNGWSGWYKGWFFRSIHELSYMINVIEKEKLSWESAEKKQYMITYYDSVDDKEKNYFSDFIVEKTKMVEVKPKRLQKSKTVIMKTNAAQKFCKKNNLIYEIIDPPPLTTGEIFLLYERGEIKFSERTMIRFLEKYKK